MSKMELIDSNKITWKDLVKKARYLRDRYKLNFPTYFYKLHKEELYNLVREKINQYNLNQDRLKNILTELQMNVSTFDNYDF